MIDRSIIEHALVVAAAIGTGDDGTRDLEAFDSLLKLVVRAHPDEQQSS